MHDIKTAKKQLYRLLEIILTLKSLAGGSSSIATAVSERGFIRLHNHNNSVLQTSDRTRDVSSDSATSSDWRLKHRETGLAWD